MRRAGSLARSCILIVNLQSPLVYADNTWQSCVTLGHTILRYTSRRHNELLWPGPARRIGAIYSRFSPESA
ncbi:hypothetical protein HDV62DRAFT_365310 [Trichoderma sp. SZMC 28011]